MTAASKWIEIFEANLNSLSLLESEFIAFADDTEKERQLFYIRILKSFYRQDHEGIHQLMAQYQTWLEQNPDLKVLCELRYCLRKGAFQVQDIQNICKTFAPTANSLFKAEISFVAASAHQMKEDYLNSEILYLEAGAICELNGAIKKSLRALLSAIAAYSCSKPESRLFAEYMNLYKKACAASEYLTAATALINISREFQRLNGLSIAREYATQAITLLQEHALGSREYGLGLVHRAHLHLEENNLAAAKQDLTYALTISHVEVQSACGAIAGKFNLNLNHLTSTQILPTWKERLLDSKTSQPLSKLEAQIIMLLSEGPRTKFELMDELYGDLIDHESKENRLKNLLSRVRSRLPNLILFQDQKYSISEPTSQTFLKRASDE